MYLLHTVALSVVLTWEFNSTGGGILPVMIFHAGANAITNWIPITAIEGAISQFAAVVIVEWIVVISRLFFYGHTDLSHHRRKIINQVKPDN